MVTGIGVVAPNGIGKDPFWNSLAAGISAVDRIQSFDPRGFPCSVAAEIRDFDPSLFFRSKRFSSIGRFAQFAVAAARLAVNDARLADSDLRCAALCFGTAAQGLADLGEAAHTRFLAKPTPQVDGTVGLEYLAHAATVHVQAELGLAGPTLTIASACCTGIDTIAWGTDQIRAGTADLAIVGAADAPLSKFILSLFSAGGYLSTWTSTPSKASRPYDLLRSGFVPGEGGAALVLEDLDHAISRRAPVFAEILGSSSVGEGTAHGRVDAYSASLVNAIHLALRHAGLVPSMLDYICAHGNSIPIEDQAEATAHRLALGAYAYRVPISSIKSMIGQPFAAGGVLQAVAAVSAIQHQTIPPTINHEFPDPACDLDYVPNIARTARLRHVLLHSHSLGGHLPGSHSAMVVGRYDSDAPPRSHIPSC